MGKYFTPDGGNDNNDDKDDDDDDIDEQSQEVRCLIHPPICKLPTLGCGRERILISGARGQTN